MAFLGPADSLTFVSQQNHGPKVGVGVPDVGDGSPAGRVVVESHLFDDPTGAGGFHFGNVGGFFEHASKACKLSHSLHVQHASGACLQSMPARRLINRQEATNTH